MLTDKTKNVQNDVPRLQFPENVSFRGDLQGAISIQIDHKGTFQINTLVS